MSPEEDRTCDTVDSEPKHYQLSYSGPDLIIMMIASVSYAYMWCEKKSVLFVGEFTCNSCGYIFIWLLLAFFFKVRNAYR